MSSLHQAASELDSAGGDSIASSPRSDVHPTDPRVRFMCSFGGKILPRPHDDQLRYVGGDTRIVAVHRSTTFSALLSKLSKLSGISNVSVKYQLPNEDLDALISVTTDEDVENMIDEYDRVAQNQNPRSARLRLFLFSEDSSRNSSIGSLLGGSTNRESWFFDALNSGSARLVRGRSDASSIISEVPDYLFGLDTSDEPKKGRPALQDSVSASDPGSPAPVVSSPYSSTVSAAAPAVVSSIPDLPPVRTRPETPEPVVIPGPVEPQGAGTYQGNPASVQYVHAGPHYSSGPPVQQMPVYYIPTGQIPQGNVPVQMHPQYVPQQYQVPQGQVPQQYQVPQGQVPQQYQVPQGQVPMMYHHQQVPAMGQVYGGAAMGPMAGLDPYEVGIRQGVGLDGTNQHPVYYGVRNPGTGIIQGNPGMVLQGGEEMQRSGLDPNPTRVPQ